MCRYLWFLLLMQGLGKLTSYERARRHLINREKSQLTGGHIRLDQKEFKVNRLLMRYKLSEIAAGRQNPEKFAAALPFLKGKDLVERSRVFRLLRNMPKGALLHVHNTAAVSGGWVRRNILCMEQLLMCTNKEQVKVLSFRRDPQLHECIDDYVQPNLLSKRGKSRGRRHRTKNCHSSFDYFLGSEVHHSAPSAVWLQFEKFFTSLSDVLLYRPVFIKFHRQMLEEMIQDNIMYAEVRMNFKPLYGPNNQSDSVQEAIELFQKLVGACKEKNPNFMGVKIITQGRKSSNKQKIERTLQEITKLDLKYPNFFIGYDLVGSEDQSATLFETRSILRKYNQIPYFFHAGETNFFGSDQDNNLLDAILLNSKRIGHALTLTKHPELLRRVKHYGIPIEICPLSNQILNFVPDLRNHPARELLARGMPLVICSDDPGIWGAKGLSYDFYYTLMSLAPEYAGLSLLKKLVWDSIKYSVLTEEEREKAFGILHKDWGNFIESELLRKNEHS